MTGPAAGAAADAIPAADARRDVPAGDEWSYVCVYIYIYIYVCIHRYVYTHIYIYI